MRVVVAPDGSTSYTAMSLRTSDRRSLRPLRSSHVPTRIDRLVDAHERVQKCPYLAFVHSVDSSQDSRSRSARWSRSELYNHFGSVDVLADVVGYNTRSTLAELDEGVKGLDQRLSVAESNLASLQVAEAWITELEASQPFVVTTSRASKVAFDEVAIAATATMNDTDTDEILLCGLMDSVSGPSTNLVASPRRRALRGSQ